MEPYRKCRQCGKPRTTRRHISRNGLCLPCGIDNHERWTRSIVERTGPEWEQYRSGQLRYARKLERSS